MKKNEVGVACGNVQGRGELGNLRKGDHLAWTGLIWLRMGIKVAGSCVRGSEPSSSVKCGELLD